MWPLLYQRLSLYIVIVLFLSDRKLDSIQYNDVNRQRLKECQTIIVLISSFISKVPSWVAEVGTG